MKDTFLKVIRTDKIFLAGHAESCASELAEMITAFVEYFKLSDWEQTWVEGVYFWTKKTGTVYYQYTIEEVFLYWYENIYKR